MGEDTELRYFGVTYTSLIEGITKRAFKAKDESQVWDYLRIERYVISKRVGDAMLSIGCAKHYTTVFPMAECDVEMFSGKIENEEYILEEITKNLFEIISKQKPEEKADSEE